MAQFSPVVGDTLGSEVGCAEGSVDGDAVGLDIGTAEGLMVGDVVGLFVGTQKFGSTGIFDGLQTVVLAPGKKSTDFPFVARHSA